MKNIKLLVFVTALLIGLSMALSISFKENRRQWEKNKRLQNNIETYQSDMERLITKDSLNAVRVNALVLTSSELKAHNTELFQELKDLKIQNKRLQALVSFQTSQLYEFSTKKRDTIIIERVVKDSVSEFKADTFFYSSYSDRWIDFYQRFEKDGEIKTKINTRDSVLVINHVEPYRFWFLRFGKKSIKTTVKSYSPYSDIDFAVSIINQGRKGR